MPQFSTGAKVFLRYTSAWRNKSLCPGVCVHCLQEMSGFWKPSLELRELSRREQQVNDSLIAQEIWPCVGMSILSRWKQPSEIRRHRLGPGRFDMPQGITSRRRTKRNQIARQQGEIYDVYDLRLALLDLNQLGYSLELSGADNAGRVYVTCKKTRNRFALAPAVFSD